MAVSEVGPKVRVVAVRREWMADLVGRTGRVVEIRENENVRAFRVEGLPGEPDGLWFAAAQLQRVSGDEDTEAA